MRKWNKNYSLIVVALYCLAWGLGVWLLFSDKIPWWVSVPLLIALGGLSPDFSTIRDVFTKKDE